MSANGTKPTSRHVRSNVANGVKADNKCSVRAFLLLTHLGHRQPNFAVMHQRHSTLW